MMPSRYPRSGIPTVAATISSPLGWLAMARTPSSHEAPTRPVFNTIVVPGVTNRFDLNGDNKITSADVLKFSPFFNRICTP